MFLTRYVLCIAFAGDNKIFINFNSALQKGNILIFTRFQLVFGRLFEALMRHESYCRSCCQPLNVYIVVRGNMLLMKFSWGIWWFQHHVIIDFE